MTDADSAYPARTADETERGRLRVNPAKVLDTLITVIADICTIDASELPPERRIDDLDVDSVSAVEILVETEEALGMSLDMRSLVGDWSGLTIGDLADRMVTEHHDRAV